MEKVKGRDIAFVLSAAFFMAIVDVLFYLLIDGNPLKSLLILGANYMMALAFWVVLYLSSLIHRHKVTITPNRALQAYPTVAHRVLCRSRHGSLK